MVIFTFVASSKKIQQQWQIIANILEIKQAYTRAVATYIAQGFLISNVYLTRGGGGGGGATNKKNVLFFFVLLFFIFGGGIF